MPYRDADRQREAVRLRVARSRARARAAGVTSAAVTPPLPPPAPPSPGDLYRVGQWLNAPQMPREEYPAYHARLRARWQELRSLLE
jgi:hypothetical protein